MIKYKQLTFQHRNVERSKQYIQDLKKQQKQYAKKKYPPEVVTKLQAFFHGWKTRKEFAKFRKITERAPITFRFSFSFVKNR
jgi:hypothetical protein